MENIKNIKGESDLDKLILIAFRDGNFDISNEYGFLLNENKKPLTNLIKISEIEKIISDLVKINLNEKSLSFLNDVTLSFGIKILEENSLERYSHDFLLLFVNPKFQDAINSAFSFTNVTYSFTNVTYEDFNKEIKNTDTFPDFIKEIVTNYEK